VGLNRIVVGRRRFDEDMPESVIADTFLHEVAHFCSSTFGLGLTEQQVEGVSGALLAVIRDNDLDFRA